MGNAYVESGKKRQNITGLGSSDDLCSIQVAFSTIYDSLQYVNSSGLTKIGGAVNSVCGGTCTGNLNPDVCTAVETALGTAQVAAIDSQWTRGP
jgi:hypothetical protein